MKHKFSIDAMSLIKFLCISFAITMILLLFLAFFLWKFQISDSVVHGGIVFAYIFSCFLGGMMFARRRESRRFLWGGVLGLFYYLIVLGISMAGNRQIFAMIPGMITIFFLCVLGGMMGGMARSGR